MTTCRMGLVLFAMLACPMLVMAQTPSTPAASPVVAVASVSVLRSLSGASSDQLAVLLLAHDAGGHGGEGYFRDDPNDTVTQDNGGTVVVDASSRRWKRMISDGNVNVQWWGAGQGSPDQDTLAIASAIRWMLGNLAHAGVGQANAACVYFPAGSYTDTLSQNLTYTSGQNTYGLCGDGENPFDSPSIIHINLTEPYAAFDFSGCANCYVRGVEFLADHDESQATSIILNGLPTTNDPKLHNRYFMFEHSRVAASVRPDGLVGGIVINSADLTTIRDSSVFNAYTFMGRYLPVKAAGAALGGGSNTIRLDGGGIHPDGYYDTLPVSIIKGAGVGETRRIAHYAGSTGVATIEGDFAAPPQAGSVFRVWAVTSKFVVIPSLPPDQTWYYIADSTLMGPTGLVLTQPQKINITDSYIASFSRPDPARNAAIYEEEANPYQSNPLFISASGLATENQSHSPTFYAIGVQNKSATLDVSGSLNYYAANTVSGAAITDLGVGSYSSIRFSGIVETTDGALLALAKPAGTLHGSFRVDRPGTFVSFQGVDIDWENASRDAAWLKAFEGKTPWGRLRKTIYTNAAVK